jgi:hypothetical protein
VRAYRRARSERTLRREADMMGLTVAVALLAALTAGDDLAPHSKLDVLAIVWGTTLGLALTHWFALLVSARLVRDPNLQYSPLELLISQTGMAVVVAVFASFVVLLVSGEIDRLGARVTAAVFIGLLVGLESKVGGSPASRALLLSAAAMVAALTIATVKWFIGR